MQTVHVRINDATTGRPTPCRVRFTDPDGTYFPPLGRLREFRTDPEEDVGGNLSLDGRAFALVDGSFEIVLSPGDVIVEASRGPEYRPIRETIRLKPGQISLRLTLERLADLRAEGWYSGDTRSSLHPHAALLEARAEDLTVVNVLARVSESSPPAIAHLLEFSGQRPALESDGHLVVVNTLNDGGELGSLGLLNCHRVVHPLRIGWQEGMAGYTLADWCEQCHRKGGLVLWSSFQDDTGGEALADLILGRIDAVEVTRWPAALQDWYDLLNCGVRVPLVGGSGKDRNTQVLGEPRTYARLRPGETFDYRAWIEAVRAGRVFITNGPLIRFTVNAQDAGAVIDAEESVRLRAASPGEELKVIWNGEVIATGSGSIDADVPVQGCGWLAVRTDDQNRAAHTSPVFIQTGDGRRNVARDALNRVLARLDEVGRRTESRGEWESERQREYLQETVVAARERLINRGKGERGA